MDDLIFGLSGECLVPGVTPCSILTLQAHLARYVWAVQFCEGKRVLDAACGAGYGSMILSWVARTVHGIDRSNVAISYARRCFATPNSNFMESSVYKFTEMSFDRIVSFETIEHLEHPKEFVEQAWEALVRGGLFIVSAPEVSDSRFHFQNYTRQQLWEVLDGWFDITQSRYFQQDDALGIVEDGKCVCECPTHIFVCEKR